ncbi:MAG: FadR/GntR family transcriptional regulator [Pyrinomonadaceae bacterium]
MSGTFAVRYDMNVNGTVPKRSSANFENIESIRNGSSAEEIVVRLCEMIRRGELNAGDRLPPERDLATQFGVSRPTLRAGIRSLTTIGILRARQGAGTFVAERTESPTLDASPLKMLSMLHGFTSDELFEARSALEVSITGLAAERATTEQIALMAEEIAGMYASFDNPERYERHEIKFHQTIASAAGNRILTSLMNMIAAALPDTRSSTIHRAVLLKGSAERHHQIYRTLCERDADGARQAMQLHLLETQRSRRFEEQDDPEQ